MSYRWKLGVFWKIQEISSLISTVFLPDNIFTSIMLEIERLKVVYPHHKIMHLSNRINCSNVKLVSYHQFLKVTNSISWCFLGWISILRNLGFLACIENTQMLRMWVKKPFQKFRLGSAFYGEGRLRAFISLTFLGKITKFLCSLEWKFPEFFKTHPTFICGSRSLWTQRGVFLGHPVQTEPLLEVLSVNSFPTSNTCTNILVPSLNFHKTKSILVFSIDG